MGIKLIENKQELIRIRNQQTATVGLIPTMGNLHEGHLQLVKESIKNNEVTFVSIFVNPTQFGPNEDYDKYPRTLNEDLRKLEEISRDSLVYVFHPSSIYEMYSKSPMVSVKVDSLDQHLCGKSRPGHFDGVVTVVCILFNLFRPTNAYFGEKDYQQLQIIKKLVEDLSFQINICSVATIREEDGLAMSSRNRFLDKKQREDALILFNTMNEIKSSIRKGSYNLSKLTSELKSRDTGWDYLEVRDARTLDLVDQAEDIDHLRIFAAYKIGDVRLIDNMSVI